MSDRNAVIVVTREWVARAESDLRAAVYLLEPRIERPTEAICFHAQQCAEKYVKALLVFRGADFPRTHDLEKLADLLPVALRPRLTIEEQRRLIGYPSTPACS